MSESLMFAILGFLVACLLGTVCASFLWRRAVTVTTRRISGKSGTDDEVAGLSAELRVQQSALSARDHEVADLRTKIASRDAERTQSETSLQKETEDLQAELTSAYSNQEAIEVALLTAQDRLVHAQDRIGVLETAIRTLTQTANVPDAPSEEQTAGDTKIADTTPSSLAAGTSKDDIPADNTDDELEFDVTRSLEERIEALKQGQPTH